jgi:hypothetical protein
MNRISAAQNLVVELQPDRWLLLRIGEAGDEHGLLEVSAGQPLRYAEDFAYTRRMPKKGVLPADYVLQVVLGWSRDDEAWHLGLLLAGGLADARGSRWCELANWPDPDRNVFNELAQQAGASLAQTLGRPFNIIPPRTQAAPAQQTAATQPLPALPLQLAGWKLEETDTRRLQLVRSPRWSFTRLTRATWYSFWLVVYVVLSVSTLNTDLALPNAGTMLPNPELLPYLGLGTAVVLILLVLYIVYEVVARPDRIVIDGDERKINALRSGRKRWQMDGNQVQSVYVTQVISKKGKKRKVYHGEINLHLDKDRFFHLLQQPDKEEPLDGEYPPNESAQDGVMPLSPDSVKTDLQAAGLHIARTLGNLPAYYDQRTR